jgi:hypothetical protein
VRPKHVTVLNLYEPGEPEGDWIVPVTGDACQAAEVLEKANIDVSFDIVFSNSLIEHVGGHGPRSALARQIHELAPRHWVQTPYRYFPLEPHWLFPGMQFLPAATRVKIATHWPLVHTKPANVDEARHDVLWTDLIGVTEMKDYFPTSAIVRERALGITKSLIAIRQSHDLSLRPLDIPFSATTGDAFAPEVRRNDAIHPGVHRRATRNDPGLRRNIAWRPRRDCAGRTELLSRLGLRSSRALATTQKSTCWSPWIEARDLPAIEGVPDDADYVSFKPRNRQTAISLVA